MTPEALIKDPLFQLNLILFLSMPVPDDAEIEPVLLKAGYSLLYIERPITVPPLSRAQLLDKGYQVNGQVCPEILLEHAPSYSFLVVECKTASFGPNSTTARQARGYLTLNGKGLSELVGKSSQETWSTTISYFSLNGEGTVILVTLEKLKKELQEISIETAESVVSLEWLLRSDGIYLCKSEGSGSPPGIDLDSPQRVLALTEGDDPRTLQLIPYSSNTSGTVDNFNERVFLERLRSAIASLFANMKRSATQHPLDELIRQVIPVWEQWKNPEETRHVRSKVRQIVGKMIHELYAATNVKCDLNQNIISLPGVSSSELSRIRGYLQSSLFRRAPMDNLLQRDLSELDDLF